MNIPVKVKKLLESNNREDVILGLETFCRLNDNPEFDIHVSNLLYYHILYKDIKIRYKDFNSLFMTQSGYYFKYKGQCFLASKMILLFIFLLPILVIFKIIFYVLL